MSRRFLILAAALLPATSFGQAWLPVKGVFNATLVYNDVSNLAHWGSTWDAPPQPDGSIALIGLSVGKSLDPWIPRTYAQARYSYAFVEKVHGISHDRDNLNLELGTFFTPRWNVSLYGAWQWTHAGITLPVPPSSPHFLYHDQVGEDEFFNAGFGTGFAVTEEMTLFAIYMKGIEGKNGHKMDEGLTFGISYGFRPRASAVFAEESSTSK
jgi:hypothetical protein